MDDKILTPEEIDAQCDMRKEEDIVRTLKAVNKILFDNRYELVNNEVITVRITNQYLLDDVIELLREAGWNAKKEIKQYWFDTDSRWFDTDSRILISRRQIIQEETK